MNANMKAFLDVIAWSEGTDNGRQKTNNRGYDVVVGGMLFHDYDDHPRAFVSLPKLKIMSSAAGRYQILSRYFDAYRLQLGLPDFGPDSQDAIALQMIKECKADGNIYAGQFDDAIRKCSSRWASLPGAGYGQHEHKLDALRKVFISKGGICA